MKFLKSLKYNRYSFSPLATIIFTLPIPSTFRALFELLIETYKLQRKKVTYSTWLLSGRPAIYMVTVDKPEEEKK